MRRSRSPLTIQTMLIRGALVASLASCGGKSSETVVMDDDDGGTGGSGAAQDSSGGASESGGGDGTGGRASSGGGNGSGATSADGGTSTGGVEGTGATGAAGGRDATGGLGAAGGEDGSGGRQATGGEGGAPEDANLGVQTLGDECDAPGTLACAGEGQKLQLLCDGDSWVQNGTCAGAAVCDTSEPNRGSCQEVPEACDGQPRDATYCRDNAVHLCGPDGLGWELLETCDGLCGDGECIVGNQCPNTAYEFVDCNGDCGPLGGCTDPHSLWSCGYFLADSATEFPVVVRTPGAPDACRAVPGDTCTDQFFLVRFLPSTESKYVKLPDGLEGRLRYDFGDGVGASAGCYIKAESEKATGCISVTPSSYDAVVYVYSPQGSGPLNVEIGEGRCP